MHIYTETGGNSSGNERKISYFPGSIKKKKREKTKKGGRKDIERYYNFKCNSLGVRPRRAIRALETMRRHRKTVCADSWPDFSLADTLLFRITGIKRVGKWRRYKRSGVQLDSGDSFDQLEERRRRTASLLK